MGGEQTAASINLGSLGCTWEAEPLTRVQVGVLQLDAKHSEVDHPLIGGPMDRDWPVLTATDSIPILINKLGHA